MTQNLFVIFPDVYSKPCATHINSKPAMCDCSKGKFGKRFETCALHYIDGKCSDMVLIARAQQPDQMRRIAGDPTALNG